jgi:hypothetical protein
MPTGKPPPGCVALEAIRPRDGKRWEVYLRQSKIEATAKRGMGAARELAYLVPFVLQNPTAVFRGVREEGASQWLCDVGSPPDAYNHKTGERLRPWADQVFLVSPMTNEEFAQLVLSKVPPDHEFKPSADYDADGDCIEFIAAPDSYYAERIDALVTVYRSQETDEIVGSLIKGVRKFIGNVMRNAPGFKIEIRDGRIKLVHIFTARLWAEAMDPNDVPGVTYQKLRQKAEETGAEVDVRDLALT